jgi:hypothetical protein
MAYEYLIIDIEGLLQGFQKWTVNYTPRGTNSVAHLLAK